MKKLLSKIISRDEAALLSAAAKKESKVVGFTSGVFDLLHSGHVLYLENARAACDFLIVGINSDSSVRQNKGTTRPIVPAPDRTKVVAALSSTDAVFIFDEKNNNENISRLKPSIYIKAGDYSPERLSSAPIVESYGGKILFVPFEEGFSTTNIIEKISNQAIDARTHQTSPAIEYKRAPALFIDRDGTVIEHVEYLHEAEKISFIPGIWEGLRAASAKGYRLILVTNQAGIGLGYFRKEDMFGVHRAIFQAASKEGVMFDKVYFCPHSASDNCVCRKPLPYFIERARDELNIDVDGSFFIGDMTTDIECGRVAGCKTVLVGTGRGGTDGIYKDVDPDFKISSLAEIGTILS